jgi:hypothetical protein
MRDEEVQVKRPLRVGADLPNPVPDGIDGKAGAAEGT